MVAASLSFRVQPERRDEILTAAAVLLAQMRGLVGCGRSILLADVQDPNNVTLASEWMDGRLAESFFASEEFQHFRALLVRDEPMLVLDDMRAQVTRLIRSR